MKRISVTTVEKFRRYLREVSYFDTLDAVIETIKGEFKGNPKTRFGSAHHKVIELGAELKPEVQISLQEMKDDPASMYSVWFTDKQLKPALKYRADHPLTGNEIWVKKEYKTRFGMIQMSGIVDVLEGLEVHDAKNTFKERDDSEYTLSCQGKFYMSMLDTNKFVYDIFRIDNFEDLPTNKPDANIVINEPYSIVCHRYKNMENDLIHYLNDVLEFINDRNLWEYLKDAKEIEAMPF